MAGNPRAAFSLAEVTVATGVAAVALTSLAGLLLGAMQGHRQSVDLGVAARLLTSAVADLRAAPPDAETSPRLGISLTGSSAVYLDETGGASARGACEAPGEAAKGSPFVPVEGGATPGAGPVEGAGIAARYRLECVAPSAPSTSPAARPVALRVTWPSGAASARAGGSLSVFVALPPR